MKLAVLVDNLGANQLAYNVIKNFNGLVEVRPEIDCIAFYENSVRPCFPTMFPIMQIYEAYGYDGVVVGTKLSNVGALLNFPMCTRKYFYVWDLEWIRFKSKYYNSLVSVYRNPNVKLIARSEEHKKIIENCWNVKVEGIVDDFNVNELIEVINGRD